TLPTIARLPARAHVDRRRRRPLVVQQRGLVDGCNLLDQILQVSLPVARLGRPREGAWKGRIAPAVRHPGGMVQHAQRSQRLDETHLAEIEVAELPVALEKLPPLAL